MLCILAFCSINGWFVLFMSHTIDHPHFMPRIFAGAIASVLLLSIIVFTRELKVAGTQLANLLLLANERESNVGRTD